ncbi:hypothetical protein ACU8KH_06044 [Lachancea thermotolerans]
MYTICLDGAENFESLLWIKKVQKPAIYHEILNLSPNNRDGYNMQ